MILMINYGVNRRSGRGLEHDYGKVLVDGVWGEVETHRRIRRAILRRHPGWTPTGYALIQEVEG